MSPKNIKKASDWREGVKRRLIGEMAESGKTKRETFAALRPLVEQQIRPMIFSANVGGSRQPKSIGEQLVDLKNEIGRVYAILDRSASSNFDAPETEPEMEMKPETEPVQPDEIPDEPEAEIKPIAAGKQRIKDELGRFLREIRRIRALCDSRAETGARLDWISMRPVQAAAKLIPAGIPANALLHAMTMHWKPELRREAGIADFDFHALSREIMKDRGIDPTGKHVLFGYVIVLAEHRQPIMLVGPAGTGKSKLALQISEYLGLDYGETPMTAGATRGDLLGRMTANPNEPFILSKFAELYSNGGVFNFEEIDAADPGMLIVLNNALAGDQLFNSSNGKNYKRHEDFVAISTANTYGIGANVEYTGREKLDAATIDRWRMGRVFIDLDENVETGILYGNI